MTGTAPPPPRPERRPRAQAANGVGA